MMEKKNVWELPHEELFATFHSSAQGLSEEEACRVRNEVGSNELAEGKKKSVLQVFLGQFCDLLVIILIIAAVISMFSDNVESAIVIIAVLFLNAGLGTLQYVKASHSLESLKKLSAPTAKVLRNGVKTELPSSALVPGDILLLEAGDLVSADGRILHGYSLQVNESALTGESTNVDKTDGILQGELPLADRSNCVFSGTLVIYGRAEVLVTATGMETEIGKIAGLMHAAKERKTPLQQSLDRFSGHLAILIMLVCLLVFGLCLYREMPILDSLMFAVSLAVAAIPEALGSIVTIVQAFGTQKMAKENAIIKDLKAVESLGCVSVICSDKTGTLTQNKMTVQKLYADDKLFSPSEVDLGERTLRMLCLAAVLSNDSELSADGTGIGDPTEYALLEMARQIPTASVRNLFSDENTDDALFLDERIRRSKTRLEEIPFDSDRKLMSTKYMLHGAQTVLTKGAIDVLLPRCDSILINGKEEPLTDVQREAILSQNLAFSESGLRVLAFAFKETTELLTLDTEYHYTFLGLISMIDPPRPESIKAVADAKSAGIRPIMITGDHKITAVAIAQKLGIFEQTDEALTGLELDALSDAQLDEQIEHISVYARVSPENKIRIVNAWQKKGHIVAMTGDGVNDAPALKKADIGVAMGITGTEVSKDASAMILSDDNFATIIKAVENGRNVYRNIKNAVLFLLSGNTAAILAVLFASFVGLSMPFSPVHLLFINLLTDSLPALAIGMEKSTSSLLKDPPRNPKVGLITKDFLLRMLAGGVLLSFATMSAYYIGLSASEAAASTMAFSTLTLGRLFHGFNCRGKESLRQLGLLSNRYSVGAFFAGVMLLALVLFIPGLHGLFDVATLPAQWYLWIAALAVFPTLLIQIWRELRLFFTR